MIARPTTGSAQFQPSATRPAPASAAAATAARSETRCGCSSRDTATYAASAGDAAISTTITTPARSSALPYP